MNQWFWTMLLAAWTASVWYGYARITSYSANGPIYFIALTVAIIPLYAVLYNGFKHYMETGWVGNRHIGFVIVLVALTIVLFRFGVIPLSRIDID